jgi:hypothetical protein
MRWLALCLLVVGCHDEFRDTATGYAAAEYQMAIGTAAVEVPIEIRWHVVDEAQLTVPITIVVGFQPTSQGLSTLELWPDPAIGEPFMTDDASVAYGEARTEHDAPGACEALLCSARYIARWRRASTTESVHVNYHVSSFSFALFEDEAELEVTLGALVSSP